MSVFLVVSTLITHRYHGIMFCIAMHCTHLSVHDCRSCVNDQWVSVRDERAIKVHAGTEESVGPWKGRKVT